VHENAAFHVNSNHFKCGTRGAGGRKPVPIGPVHHPVRRISATGRRTAAPPWDDDMSQLKYGRVLAAGFGLCTAGAARAQSLTVDDFTTGPVSIQFNGIKQKGDLAKSTAQKGSGILGGSRQTQLSLDLTGSSCRPACQRVMSPARRLARHGRSNGFARGIRKEAVLF
jgi:hypothetical protein